MLYFCRKVVIILNIYFKFLNDYFELDNSLDNICGDSPEHFVEFIDENWTKFSFIKIRHNDKDYYVHISNLQWCD